MTWQPIRIRVFPAMPGFSVDVVQALDTAEELMSEQTWSMYRDVAIRQAVRLWRMERNQGREWKL